MPGYLSDNCCYLVNDKDLLGGKVFGPATFRLVFRMLYSELWESHGRLILTVTAHIKVFF